MRSLPILKVALLVLLLLNLFLSILLSRALWREKCGWRAQIYGMASYAGSLQAKADYHAGNLRLYKIAVEGDIKFTGRTDGPFEIWTWPTHPVLGEPEKYSSETYVDFYNKRMRSLQEVQPDRNAEP